MCTAGFDISVFSFEKFQSGHFSANPPISKGIDVLYRGWMLSASEYKVLSAFVGKAGARLHISPESYLANHYLPNWYPHIKDLTPETRIYPSDCDLESELRKLDWPDYFVKDYVKSLKTSVGSRLSKPEQVSVLVEEMKRFRGCIEGGFCIRRVEEFLSDTELRYFVIDGKAHGSTPDDVPQIVQECARRLQNRFYSVDAVKRADGQLRIVEVGDGQVSDLVGWLPERFADVLAEHFLGARPTQK
jgi:hypothetical protein